MKSEIKKPDNKPDTRRFYYAGYSNYHLEHLPLVFRTKASKLEVGESFQVKGIRGVLIVKRLK